MDDRGSALLEALIVTALVGLIWAAAGSVLVQVPAQAAKWEDASAMRQRLRVIETRLARIVSSAGPIVVPVDGSLVRIPSIWPRRLGLTRPGGAGEVSATAVTFLSRVDGHRVLTLAGTLAATGGEVLVVPQPACGSEAACGLREADAVLVVASNGACGLYRVEAAGVRMRLSPLMQPAAPSFPAASAMVPIAIDVMSLDSDESAVRRYDGYRSDNVMIDGVRALAIEWAPALGDGPFVGSGPLAFDVDQLAIATVRLTIDLLDTSASAAQRTSLSWRSRAWP